MAHEGGGGVTADEDLLAKVRERLGPIALEASRTAPRRLSVRVAPERAKEAVLILKDHVECRHLSGINGFDTGDAIEVMYHMSARGGVVITVHAALPRADPRIATVTDLLPAANLYERETRDLFGVEFDGHPDPRRLMLYEGWPEGEHPLRRDWKPKPQGGEPHA